MKYTGEIYYDKDAKRWTFVSGLIENRAYILWDDFTLNVPYSTSDVNLKKMLRDKSKYPPAYENITIDRGGNNK